jgi:hypothetical protein
MPGREAVLISRIVNGNTVSTSFRVNQRIQKDEELKSQEQSVPMTIEEQQEELNYIRKSGRICRL